MVSYRRSGGERIWVYDVKADGAAQTFHGEMARHDGDLLVASDPDEGHVYRFEAATGDVRWKWPSETGVSSDLVVWRGRVLAVTLAHELVALDVDTGRELWRTEPVEADPIAPVTASPLVWDDSVVFGRADGRLSLHEPEAGVARWTADLGAGVSTDLVRFGDDVVMGLEDGRLVRVDPRAGGILAVTTLESVPTYRWFVVGRDVVGLTDVGGPERRVVSADATTLEVRWSVAAPDTFRWTIAQPAVAEDEILVGTNEPALYGLDPATGDFLWRAETNASPRTVTVVGAELYMGTFSGELFAYRMGAVERREEAARPAPQPDP